MPTTSEPPVVEPVIELEKKAPPTKADAPAKPLLPSAIADADGEEENEPTQLYEPSAASRRAAELAAMEEKQLEDVKKSFGMDKKGETDKVDIRLPDAKSAAEKIEVNEADLTRSVDDQEKKVKAQFGVKPKMLGLHEVAEITGHEVGGVCPFGLKEPLPVYCDVSLKAFDVVLPAAGSTHSAVRITPSRLAELTSAEWVDLCEHRPPAEAPAYSSV